MILVNILKRSATAAATTDNLYGPNEPTQGGAIAFVDMFSWALTYTIWRCYRYRRSALNPLGVCFLFLGTPILEVAGFAVRIPSVNDSSDKTFYLVNNIILGLAPLYLTAVNYIVFASLVLYAGQRFSTLHSRALLWGGIIILIQCVHLQARGLSQAYNYNEDQSYRNVGAGIMLGGLGLNLVEWIIYTILFMVFVTRYFREHVLRAEDPETSRVRTTSVALMINIVMFMIRIIYRIVEFSKLIQSQEKLNVLWFYIWDATPIWIGVVAFSILLPYDLPYGAAFLVHGASNHCCHSWTSYFRRNRKVATSTEPSIKTDNPDDQ